MKNGHNGFGLKLIKPWDPQDFPNGAFAVRGYAPDPIRHRVFTGAKEASYGSASTIAATSMGEPVSDWTKSGAVHSDIVLTHHRDTRRTKLLPIPQSEGIGPGPFRRKRAAHGLKAFERCWSNSCEGQH